MKRESGENPERSGHCKQGVYFQNSHWETGKAKIYYDVQVRKPANI